MGKLIITGDLFPVDENKELFQKGMVEEILGEELQEIFLAADIRIANLEGPFTTSIKPIPKSGPALKADPKCIVGISKMGFDIISMANNHILDFGEEGYYSTIKLLDDNGIRYLGAGKNVTEARKPIVIDVYGVKVGIYACAEYEFTIASEMDCGANPFDGLYSLDDVSGLRKEVDYLIVLYHGMKELYRYPAPYVMKRCRRLVDKGADLVLCQHSHCIGCFEEYNGSTILYGQGDFCFCSGNLEERSTGLIVELTLPEKIINFIPIQRKDNVIRKATNNGDTILAEFYHRSEEIKDYEFVEKKYNQFAEEMLESYLIQSLGRVGGWLMRIKKTNLVKRLFRNYHRLDLLNCLRCEAHNDLFIRGLAYGGKKDNENK